MGRCHNGYGYGRSSWSEEPLNASLPFAGAAAGHGSEPVSTVLLALAFVLDCAKLAGELVERQGQPAVLG